MERLIGGMYRFTEWVMRLAYVNFLWILFSLLGLLAFGVLPATAAMFTVTRKWLEGEEDLPIFRTFWTFYKRDFVRANLGGYLLLLMGVGLYFDFIFIRSFSGLPFHFFQIGLICLVLLLTVTIVFFFPVLSQHQGRTFDAVKLSFLIGISNPIRAILMIASFFSVTYISLKFPTMFIFFSSSSITWLFVYFSTSALLNKRKNIQTQA